ncbi:MAG: plastocyanin/azurin family copper-binding protein [Chloroflexota bacterium]
MRLSRLALIPAAALLLAACSGGGVASPTPAVAASTPAASPSAPGSSGLATRIEVTLADSMTMEPAAMTVPAGIPVTFVVTNAGKIDHEFYLGDEGAQAEHEMEMGAMGGMTHDEPEGIAVKPGETKELTFTFEMVGTMLAGCHVAGHYDAGMRAEITVAE